MLHVAGEFMWMKPQIYNLQWNITYNGHVTNFQGWLRNYTMNTVHQITLPYIIYDIFVFFYFFWLCVFRRLDENTNIHTYMRTYVHTYIRTTYICTYVHMYICTYVHTYIRTTYICTYVHTYIRTYAHTHIRIYVHIPVGAKAVLFHSKT